MSELNGDVIYQNTAVEKIVRAFKELVIAHQPNATMIFKAPTGSGKTVMMAMALNKLLEESLPNEFVYLWASMGDLAHQSFEKLSKQYLPDSEYNMLELESISDDALPANTILFCNWEKMYTIKKEADDDGNIVEVFDNHFIKVGESGRNLQNVLNLTCKEGRKVILIVDEAHHTYLGENSQKLVYRIIKPMLTIEVSATPLIKLPDGYYEKNLGRYIQAPLRDVIDSGLIKNNTIINNDISGVIDKNSADTAVLAAALKQREILSQKFRDLGKKINPLVLIQLPSEGKEISAVDETTAEMVERFMESQGISFDNGKLAIWVSGNHFPSDVKTSTIPNDSPIEVLIFKQAIATGWDCPRAAILVMLRDVKSVVFEIQTVGRILRMPELVHYKDPALNSAYVYTNINEIALHEDDDTKTFFKTFVSHRKADFSDHFIWPNIYRKRVVGQRHRLNQNFRKYLLPKLDEAFDIDFMDTFNNRYKKVAAVLKIDAEELTIPILADIVFAHLDEIDQSIFQNGNRVNLNADKPYIERTFNYFLIAACSPYAPHDSSRILKSVIYKWFSENGFDDEGDVQRIIACSKENQAVLLNAIGEAKASFAETMDKETELTRNGFSIPLDQEFGEGYEAYPAHKHALFPYYRSKEMWNTEKYFEARLDDSYNVEWWYRNGVSEPKYFGVQYQKESSDGTSEDAIFYPDYIAKFTDGTIGIFDTKSGDTIKPNKTMGGSVDQKANSLQYFFRNYNQIADECATLKIDVTAATGLWGGIVKVLSKDSFQIQADAITQLMAKKLLNCETVDVPSVGYSATHWKTLDF